MHTEQDEKLQSDGVTGPGWRRQEAVGGGQHGPVERGLVQLGLEETGFPSRRIPPSLTPAQAVQEMLLAPARRHGPSDSCDIGCMAAYAVGAAGQLDAGEPNMCEQPRLDAVASRQRRLMSVEEGPKFGKQPRHWIDGCVDAGSAGSIGFGHNRMPADDRQAAQVGEEATPGW